MSAVADIAVAGAGPWGLAGAWRAAAAGARVALVDDGRPPAAHVAAGMLGPWSEYDPRERDLHGAMVASAQAWPRFAAAVAAAGRDSGHRPGGSLLVAGRPEEVGRLRDHARLLADLGHRIAWQPGSALRAAEPGLGAAVIGGLHLPGEGQVEPRLLLEALREACRAAGVVSHHGRAVAVARRRGRPGGLTLEDGRTIAAGRVLLAAGVGSARLDPTAAVRPVKGQILRLHGPAPLPVTGTVRSPSVYIAARDREVVVGATSEERSDPVATAAGVHGLLDEALNLVPELGELTLVEAAAGLRPATGDGRPLVGAIEPGVVVATGGYRHGLLLTPLASAAAWAALEQRTPPAHCAGWQPRNGA